MKLIPHSRLKARQGGFTLVEIMIAVTLGLMIVAGLTAMFVNTTRTQNQIEQVNRQIENGRYAMQLLNEDLRHAGFYGEFDPNGTPALPSPTSLPNPCSATMTDLVSAMPLAVQGYDQTATLTCVSDRKANTDILVVRRVSTCSVDEANCDAEVAGLMYFQASLCNATTELGSTDPANFFRLDSDTGNLDRHKRDCTADAVKRRYLTHIYFIANNNVGTDGIPTLKRAELSQEGGSPKFVTVPLVEGIENLQVEYGIDTDGDGTPDDYNAAPSTFNTCAGSTCIDNWKNVMAVKLHVLARSLTADASYSDLKTYKFGLAADSTANNYTPGDHFRRNLYQGVVGLVNPIGRRAP